MAWSEHLHPRDKDGKFTHAGGGVSRVVPGRKGGRKTMPKPSGGPKPPKAPSALKPAQDARIRSATRSRVQADIAETRRQRAIYDRRPHKNN